MEFRTLNASQREAVTTTEGPVRILAGAGSGKTRALTSRFAFLVNDLGILPGNILCVTFTNKAAGEMRQRIHALTGDNDTGYINTFHGFCVSVLQEDSHAVQYPRSFLVLDNSDIDDMLRIIYEERDLSLRDMSFGQARDMIEMQKLVRKPEYYEDMIDMSLEALHTKYLQAANTEDAIFYGYLYQEKKCFGLDYNDLLKYCLYIFSRREDIRLKWQKRLEYIMIDEFQDIDAIQYELMEVLCGHHGNLCIVGDPDQTIYTWRGADVRFMLDFDKRFPGTKTIYMMENYRSTPQILAAANALISKNKTRIPKELKPMLPDGESVLCHHAKNAQEEAEWISVQMLAMHESGIPFRDMTVLYRAHYVTRTVEDVLLRRKIPYTIYSGAPFFGRTEIKDALSYLRMVAYKDDLSFRRVVNLPRRNMGQRRMKYLEEQAAARGCTLYEALLQTWEEDIFKGTKAGSFISLVEGFAAEAGKLPVSELLAKLLDASGYEAMRRTEGAQDRLDNLAELKQSVHEYEISCGEELTLEHYLAHVALFTNTDALDEAGDRVKLMTVHAAKGLEFPYVFLCAMNEGVFPSRRTRTMPAMEEERRLAYVAVTRARKRLFLSEAEGRNLDGSPRYPSRFILDIGQEHLEYTTKPRDRLIAEARAYIESSERYLPENLREASFAIGERVSHDYFGPGTVVGIDLDKNAHIVQFDNMETPRSISFRVKLDAVPRQEENPQVR